MSSQELRRPLYIFHVNRESAGPDFFHVVGRGRRLMDQLRGVEIRGRYGEEPSIESLTILRNDFYRRTEEAVRDWIADLRFTPRFVLAAVTFLATYFFFSYVVRDPFPILDEVVLGLAAAVLAYVGLGKTFQASDAAVKARLELRATIDGVMFSESEFVKRVETYLSQLDAAGPESALSLYLENPLPVEPGWEEEAAAFTDAITARLADKGLRRLDRRLSAYEAGKKRAEKSGRLASFASNKKLDLPLLLLFRKLQHRSGERKA